MTTSIAITTGARAAAVNAIMYEHSYNSEGNDERTVQSHVQVSTFIPPHSSWSGTVSASDDFQVRELPEGVTTIDDVRRGAAVRAATDIDEKLDRTVAEPDSYGAAFQEQAEQPASDNRDPLPASAQEADEQPDVA